MKKKLFILLISGVLFNSVAFSTLGTNVNAETQNNDTVEIMDITENANYMVSKGQINVSDLKLSISDNDEVKLQSQDDSISTKNNITINKLNEQFQVSNEFNKMLSEKLKNGANIPVIGYTEVIVEKNELGQIIPVTKSKYFNDLISDDRFSTSSFETGQPTEKGKLTLTTFAEVLVYQNEKYVSAYTNAHWSGWDSSFFTAEFGPGQGPDYMSITVPSRYIIFGKYFWSEFYNYSGVAENWCTNDTEHALVYGFNEIKQVGLNFNTYTTSAQITATAKSPDASTKFEKFSSQYVHTYDQLTISPTVSTGGSVDFAISSQEKAWKIASSVTSDF